MVWGTWDEDFCVDCCLQILNVIKHLTCTGFKYSCGTLTCAPLCSLVSAWTQCSDAWHEELFFFCFFPRPNPSITFQKTVWMCSCYIFMFQDLKKRKKKIRNNGVPNTEHNFQAHLQLRAFNDVLCKKWNYWSVNILYWITVFQYEQTSNLML